MFAPERGPSCPAFACGVHCPGGEVEAFQAACSVAKWPLALLLFHTLPSRTVRILCEFCIFGPT